MNTNIAMASQIVSKSIEKIKKQQANKKKLPQKTLQYIATFVMENSLLSGTLSNRLGEKMVTLF